MATRCNIIIKGKSCGKNVKTMLYRHWDGYPECTGKSLYKKVREACYEIYFDAFVTSLMQDEGRHYEYSSNLHGDIEYLYTVDTVAKKVYVQEVTYDANDGYKQVLGRKKVLPKHLRGE